MSDRHGFWKDLYRLRPALNIDEGPSGSQDIYDHFGCAPYNDNDVKRERRDRARLVLGFIDRAHPSRGSADNLLDAFDEADRAKRWRAQAGQPLLLEHRRSLGRHASGAAGMMVIVVEHLPEGVWLATSPDIPGLVVEMPTKDEAVIEARKVATELLSMRPPFDCGSGGTSLQMPNVRAWAWPTQRSSRCPSACARTAGGGASTARTSRAAHVGSSIRSAISPTPTRRTQGTKVFSRRRATSAATSGPRRTRARHE
jgi:hypothetical protein